MSKTKATTVNDVMWFFPETYIISNGDYEKAKKEHRELAVLSLLDIKQLGINNVNKLETSKYYCDYHIFKALRKMIMDIFCLTEGDIK